MWRNLRINLLPNISSHLSVAFMCNPKPIFNLEYWIRGAVKNYTLIDFPRSAFHPSFHHCDCFFFPFLIKANINTVNLGARTKINWFHGEIIIDFIPPGCFRVVRGRNKKEKHCVDMINHVSSACACHDHQLSPWDIEEEKPTNEADSKKIAKLPTGACHDGRAFKLNCSHYFMFYAICVGGKKRAGKARKKYANRFY